MQVLVKKAQVREQILTSKWNSMKMRVLGSYTPIFTVKCSVPIDIKGKIVKSIILKLNYKAEWYKLMGQCISFHLN